MNARVFLLLLVTGLFMAAWNGDQEAKHEFLAQRAIRRAAVAVANVGNSGSLSADTGPDATVRLAGPMPKSGPFTRCQVGHFRPRGMAAGRYRAVSEAGVTFELTVENSAHTAARGHYAADSPNGTRWYFIRIDAAG